MILYKSLVEAVAASFCLTDLAPPFSLSLTPSALPVYSTSSYMHARFFIHICLCLAPLRDSSHDFAYLYTPSVSLCSPPSLRFISTYPPCPSFFPAECELARDRALVPVAKGFICFISPISINIYRLFARPGTYYPRIVAALLRPTKRRASSLLFIIITDRECPAALVRARVRV